MLPAPGMSRRAGDPPAVRRPGRVLETLGTLNRCDVFDISTTGVGHEHGGLSAVCERAAKYELRAVGRERDATLDALEQLLRRAAHDGDAVESAARAGDVVNVLAVRRESQQVILKFGGRNNLLARGGADLHNP